MDFTIKMSFLLLTLMNDLIGLPGTNIYISITIIGLGHNLQKQIKSQGQILIFILYLNIFNDTFYFDALKFY